MHAKREILFWTNPAECRHWLQHKRIFFYAVTKRGTWHVWASQLEFSPLASVCLCCVNTKPLSTFAEHHGFGSAYLSFTTCFLFAGRMPVCAHHNHMMLKPTPNIMTASCCISHLVFFFFASSFNFPFLMSVCLLHQPPSVHLSLALLHHVVLSCWTVSYFQSSLRNLSFPFFFYFSFTPSSAASLQSNSRSHNQALLPHRISCQKPVSFVSLDRTNIMAVSK